MSLSNSDFRSLLASGGSKSGGGSSGGGSAGGGGGGGGGRGKGRGRFGDDSVITKANVKDLVADDQRRHKQHAAAQKHKQKDDGDAREQATAETKGPQKPKYRDRARERREGANPDYQHSESLLSSMTVEQSKFLGGDQEHTHLVKGLDFSLLQRKRAERGAGEGLSAEQILQAADDIPDLDDDDDDGEPSGEGASAALTFHTRLGRAIASRILATLGGPRPPDAPGRPRAAAGPRVETFLPLRTSFEFVLDGIDPVNNDVPTVVAKSKEDWEAAGGRAALDGRVTAPVLADTLQVLRQALESRRAKKKRPAQGAEGADEPASRGGQANAGPAVVVAVAAPAPGKVRIFEEDGGDAPALVAAKRARLWGSGGGGYFGGAQGGRESQPAAALGGGEGKDSVAALALAARIARAAGVRSAGDNDDDVPARDEAAADLGRFAGLGQGGAGGSGGPRVGVGARLRDALGGKNIYGELDEEAGVGGEGGELPDAEELERRLRGGVGPSDSPGGKQPLDEEDELDEMLSR